MDCSLLGFTEIPLEVPFLPAAPRPGQQQKFLFPELLSFPLEPQSELSVLKIGMEVLH